MGILCKKKWTVALNGFLIFIFTLAAFSVLGEDAKVFLNFFYEYYFVGSIFQPVEMIFYATLAYIRHFIFAGCYDPWYLVVNLAGHLDFAGFYFSKCPSNSKPPANSSDEESPSVPRRLFIPALQ